MTSKPTILYLHPHFTLGGGAGKFVLETGKLLAQKGYHVKVISIKANAAIIRDYQKQLEFISIGGPLSSSIFFWLFFPVSLIKVGWVISREPNAILFPQVFPANWWGFAYKLMAKNRKLLWMCQEPSAFLHSQTWISALPTSVIKSCLLLTRPLLAWIDVRLAQQSDHIICNSQHTLINARQIYGYDRAKTSVVYLGADLKTFQNKNETRRHQIITVCRLSKFKNVDLILRALQIINANQAQPLKLIIVGDGEERQNLEKLAIELNISEAVEFVGDVTNPHQIAEHLNRSKAFVMASIGEPFGIAPVEAMACGTPAVVSNSGGLTETVISGQTGFHFEGGNVNSLVESLKPILNGDATFRKLSQAATKRGQQFSWQTTADQVEKRILQLSK